VARSSSSASIGRLDADVPGLQVGGHVIRFLCGDLGGLIASSALFEPIGNRFRRQVKRFAKDHGISILEQRKPNRSRWHDCKIAHGRANLKRAEREGRDGAVPIAACPKFQWVFSGRNCQKKTEPGRTSSSPRRPAAQ
jgi:hypothetical protein